MEAALSSEERQAVSLSSSPPNETTVTPGATVSIQGVGAPVDLAKLLGKSSTCEALLKMVREEKRKGRENEEELFQCEEQTRSQSTTSSANSQSPSSSNGEKKKRVFILINPFLFSGFFHKRCPLCALLFRSATSLIDHLQLKHPDHPPIDLDLLPEADDVCQSIHLQYPNLFSISGSEGIGSPSSRDSSRSESRREVSTPSSFPLLQ